MPDSISYRCLLCGGDFGAAGCRGCGATLNYDLTVTPPGPCGRCEGMLQRVPIGGASSGVSVLSCEGCRGAFIDASDWSRMFTLPALARDRAFVPAPPGAELPASKMLKFVPCASCGREMDRITFDKQGPTLDVCARHGVWVDAGELPQVLNHVHKFGRASGYNANLERAKMKDAVSHVQARQAMEAEEKERGKEGNAQLVCGLVGLAVGGSLGAIVGQVVGRAVDRAKIDGQER